MEIIINEATNNITGLLVAVGRKDGLAVPLSGLYKFGLSRVMT